MKDALFFMGNDKSPGPDGYTAAFFKEAWDIVADDVTNAVSEFFINGRILKELNHTIIALIPKVRAPTCVIDYRPISCCNVLFKCISKIIANRIKESLKALVSPNQSVLFRVVASRITFFLHKNLCIIIIWTVVLLVMHLKLISKKPMIRWIGIF